MPGCCSIPPAIRTLNATVTMIFQSTGLGRVDFVLFDLHKYPTTVGHKQRGRQEFSVPFLPSLWSTASSVFGFWPCSSHPFHTVNYVGGKTPVRVRRVGQSLHRAKVPDDKKYGFGCRTKLGMKNHTSIANGSIYYSSPYIRYVWVCHGAARSRSRRPAQQPTAGTKKI
jgi:hypothetical protein